MTSLPCKDRVFLLSFNFCLFVSAFVFVLVETRGPIFKFHYPRKGAQPPPPQTLPHNFSKIVFICKIKIITVHVNAYPECTKNALKWTREVKEYGYVLEYKALLISIGRGLPVFLRLGLNTFRPSTCHLVNYWSESEASCCCRPACHLCATASAAFHAAAPARPSASFNKSAISISYRRTYSLTRTEQSQPFSTNATQRKNKQICYAYSPRNIAVRVMPKRKWNVCCRLSWQRWRQCLRVTSPWILMTSEVISSTFSD